MLIGDISGGVHTVESRVFGRLFDAFARSGRGWLSSLYILQCQVEFSAFRTAWRSLLCQRSAGWTAGEVIEGPQGVFIGHSLASIIEEKGVPIDDVFLVIIFSLDDDRILVFIEFGNDTIPVPILIFDAYARADFDAVSFVIIIFVI